MRNARPQERWRFSATAPKDCAKKGIPLALLENGTNKVYVLLPNKDKSALPDEVMKKIAEQVTSSELVLDALLPGVQHLQNIHPLVVHFPVAFLAGATVVYILAWRVGHDSWAWTGLWLLVLGTLSGAVAVGTGLYADPGVMVARSVRTALLVPHKRVMLGTLGLSAAVTVWAALARPFPARGRRLFIVLLFVLFAGMTKGADYGARMVYDYNAGGDACGQPIDFTK